MPPTFSMKRAILGLGGRGRHQADTARARVRSPQSRRLRHGGTTPVRDDRFTLERDSRYAPRVRVGGFMKVNFEIGQDLSARPTGKWQAFNRAVRPLPAEKVQGRGWAGYWDVPARCPASRPPRRSGERAAR